MLTFSQQPQLHALIPGHKHNLCTHTYACACASTCQLCALVHTASVPALCKIVWSTCTCLTAESEHAANAPYLAALTRNIVDTVHALQPDAGDVAARAAMMRIVQARLLLKFAEVT